jgi:hypothetical protein
MPGQRTFVEDESEFVVAQTTRRAGKTTGDVIKGLLKVSRRPQVAGYYVTITRELAAELAWEPLKRFNRDHHLGGEPNETKLSIQLPNGSLFRCGGCKDRQEAEKWRGRMKVAIAIVDEGQSVPRLGAGVPDQRDPGAQHDRRRRADRAFGYAGPGALRVLLQRHPEPAVRAAPLVPAR